jgi:hypothetical protein
VNAVVSSRGLAEHQAGVDSEQQQNPQSTIEPLDALAL